VNIILLPVTPKISIPINDWLYKNPNNKSTTINHNFCFEKKFPEMGKRNLKFQGLAIWAIVGLVGTVTGAQVGVMDLSFGSGWQVGLGGKLLKLIRKFFLNKSRFERLNNIKIEN
jgi:hypothetical protein